MKLVRTAFAAILLSAAALPVIALPARADIVFDVGAPPPLLPVYEQPPLPDVGYLWVPGYWAYDNVDGYFWVPGTWILPPRPGLLWTPGYWAFEEGAYLFHAGYWGEQVGYYGGVDYGFGYTGAGYRGGYWRGGSFFYNTAVTRITNANAVNVYNETIVVPRGPARVSFNGGPGGIRLQPTPDQIALMHRPHVGPTPLQRRHVELAHKDPALRNRENHGRPPLAATPRPDAFGQGRDEPGRGGPGAGRAPGAPHPVTGTPGQPMPRPVIGTPAEPRGLHGERPREERPRGERPDMRRPDMRRQDMPRQDMPRQDMPRQDMPRQDMPRQDMPRQDMPRQDMRRPDMRAHPGGEPGRPRPAERGPREFRDAPRPTEMRPREERPGPRTSGPHPSGPRPEGPHPGPRPEGARPGGPGSHPGGPHPGGPGPHPHDERR